MDRGSHGGNNSFPRWDYDVPTVGLVQSHRGNTFKYKQYVEAFFLLIQKKAEDLTFIFKKVPVYGHFRRFRGSQDLT